MKGAVPSSNGDCVVLCSKRCDNRIAATHQMTSFPASACTRPHSCPRLHSLLRVSMAASPRIARHLAVLHRQSNTRSAATQMLSDRRLATPGRWLQVRPRAATQMLSDRPMGMRPSATGSRPAPRSPANIQRTPSTCSAVYITCQVTHI